ncbi:cell wall-binding repeat-containing protein [Clostridium sp. Mt-5]|uniref:Cell wall-binding repeat-containing protein n=1 Tax=Clostridium moutaii TaxID=3240932 RepID=A0ABV4BNU8_9CLOT
MIKKNKMFLKFILGVFFVSSAGIVLPQKAFADVPRLGGQDRYQTSSKISQSGWDTSDYVVLASGENYPDALCAAPIAKKYSAPILLTTSKTLNGDIKDEITRLKAKHVIEIGGTASISDDIENELKTMGLDPQRIGGQDRFETSVKVAEALGTVTNAVVTSAYGFADALSIAPIAASENIPILLTGSGSLPDVVKNYISENASSIKSSYVIGGNAVISDNVVSELPSAERISGQNRFETNVNVLNYFKDKIKFDNLYVVQADGPTGNEFADALSTSVLAAKTASPIILTYNSVSLQTENFLKANAAQDAKVTAIGGIIAVPESIVSSLQDILDGKIPENPAPGADGSQSDYDIFSSALEKLKTIDTSSSLSLNDTQKEIISDTITSIGKYVANSSYNYKQDAPNIEALYNTLSESQKSNLKSVIVNSGITPAEGFTLIDKFGL